MSLIKVQAVVLKSFNLGENDKIITLYTDKLGKVDCVVHGARRPRSKFMASVQPFCYGEYVIFEGQSLYTLNQSDIIESFQKIIMNLDNVTYGSYFLELIDNISEKENKNVSLLALLLKTLYIMTLGETNLMLLRVAVDFKAISLSGYMPQVSVCIKCKKHIETGFFNISEGGMLCLNCKGIEHGYTINNESLKLLQNLKIIKLENLTNINYDEKTVQYVQNVMTQYIVFRTNKEFKSISLINLTTFQKGSPPSSLGAQL